MNTIEEIWKPVQGYEGAYEASNLGNVRSLNRVIHYQNGSTRNRKGKVLKPHIDTSGYAVVYLAVSGHQSAKFVHTLVAKCFLPNDDPTLEVNHKDGNKSNNCVENLEWCTHRENILHAFQTGLHGKPLTEHMKAIAKKGARVSASRSSIPVICETDGLAFASQNSADRYYGYYPGSVCNAIKRNKSFKGNRFRVLDDSEINSFTLLS